MPHRTTCRATRRASLALTLMLAGCGFRPASPSAGLTLPERLATLPPDAPQPVWPAADWWRGFGSPELDALMEAASTVSFDVRAAEARLRQADANVRVAGQALLPTGNLGLTGTRSQSGSSATSVGTNLGSRVRLFQRETISLTQGASYEVDFWGRTRNTVLAAQESAYAFLFDVGVVRLTTQASMANAYFAILSAQERLEIQEANLRAADRVLGVLRARLAAGTSNGLDVIQQETLVAQTRAQIPALRQSLEQNYYSLAVLAGVTPDAVPRPRLPIAQLRVPEVVPGLPAEIIVRRPDVWEAEANLASAQANVAAARAALLPTVQLTASGGFQTLILENLLRPGSIIYTLSAGITQPVFQQWQLRAQRDYNQARAEELLETYRRTIVAALADVEGAAVALRDTTETEQLQALATQSAERANAVAEAQLRAGTIDLITLLNTQTTLFNARNLLAQARLLRLQAAVGLFRALGGGWS